MVVVLVVVALDGTVVAVEGTLVVDPLTLDVVAGFVVGVVTPTVVVGLCTAANMALTVDCWGALGVTPWGSNAMVTRRYWANLIDDGLVVMMGFFCPNVVQ